MRKACSITPWGPAAEHTVDSSLKRSEGLWTCATEDLFSVALGDVMPVSPGPRKCTMTNGVPCLWMHTPFQRSSNRQNVRATQKAELGECVTARHRRPSANPPQLPGPLRPPRLQGDTPYTVAWLLKNHCLQGKKSGLCKRKHILPDSWCIKTGVSKCFL